MTKRISVLGSTGSIGKNTLDIVRRAEEGTYDVVALTANRSVEILAAQAKEFKPEFVALADANQAEALKAALSGCLLYTSPSPRDGLLSRMPSSA